MVLLLLFSFLVSISVLLFRKRTTRIAHFTARGWVVSHGTGVKNSFRASKTTKYIRNARMPVCVYGQTCASAYTYRYTYVIMYARICMMYIYTHILCTRSLTLRNGTAPQRTVSSLKSYGLATKLLIICFRHVCKCTNNIWSF